MTGLEPASFEVERFELGRDACLEVRGRWFGVRGRRFIRPTLTAVADGRERRVLAVLDHKPWIANEGESWLAAFPWSADPAALVQAELTVAPDVTVPLPPPSSPAPDRRRRVGSSRSPRRGGEPSTEPMRVPSDRHDQEDRSLQVEHGAALQALEETLSELDAVKRDRERLRSELGQALAARETAIAERHSAIEAEVELRIADLRAEAERERAAAGLAAQIARERDAVRLERAEALRERDEAHAERDAARRERNRMLADRDTARTRAAEAVRQWEVTAALGAHRTHERDAIAGERDRMARERDVAIEERDRTAQARDAALEERDCAAHARDLALEQRERTAREHNAAVQATEPMRALLDVERSIAGPQPDTAPPTTPIYGGASVRRRPRRPPAPGEAHRGASAGRTLHSSLTAEWDRPRNTHAMWRMRLLTLTMLLIALVALVAILASK
jgi:hypothetical protein